MSTQKPNLDKYYAEIESAWSDVVRPEDSVLKYDQWEWAVTENYFVNQKPEQIKLSDGDAPRDALYEMSNEATLWVLPFYLRHVLECINGDTDEYAYADEVLWYLAYSVPKHDHYVGAILSDRQKKCIYTIMQVAMSCEQIDLGPDIRSGEISMAALSEYYDKS